MDFLVKHDTGVCTVGTVCKIRDFQGGGFEECHLLGCYAMWFLQEPHGITSQKTAFLMVQW
jgi:hypothetical protein